MKAYSLLTVAPFTSDMASARRAVLAGGAALILLAATLALYWPGFASYDSIVQYEQLLSGAYDDWHPPIMARLWALLGGAASGTAPMFLLQMALYWLGLGLIAAQLARRGRVRAAGVTLALGLLPPVLGWQVVVLKDAQMSGALIAAAGLAGWWQLDGRAVPRWGWSLIALLLLYGALVRANGAMAAVPLGIMLAGRPRRWLPRGLAMLGGIGALLALAPLVNHGLLGASSSDVARSEPLFDLAGIAVRVPDEPIGGLGPGSGAALQSGHCATPLYWDALGTDECARIIAPWQIRPIGALYATLAETTLRHPIAYAAHRLAHFNSTERWLVPRDWPNAAPIDANEPNHLGLAAPGQLATRSQHLAARLSETPLGWPVCYTLAGLFALIAALGQPASPPARFAAALSASALLLDASFAVISIASDLRYHLWSMLAVGLALAILPWPPSGRLARHATALLALTIVAGLGARLILPPYAPPPATDVPPGSPRPYGLG